MGILVSALPVFQFLLLNLHVVQTCLSWSRGAATSLGQRSDGARRTMGTSQAPLRWLIPLAMDNVKKKKK